MMLLVWCLVVLAYGKLAAACEDPVPEIPQLAQRTPGHEVVTREPLISDHELSQSKWYSAAGFKMSSAESFPDSLPVSGRCGTLFPVYLTTQVNIADLGSDPAPAQMRIGGLYQDHPGAEFGIEIRKCDSGIQYFLPPTPIRFAGYCFDQLDDTSIAPEFRNCGSHINEEIVSSYLTPHINSGFAFYNETQADGSLVTRPATELTCEMYPFTTGSLSTQFAQYADYSFRVLWFVDSKLLRFDEPFLGQDFLAENRALNETDLVAAGYDLNSYVQCGIEISVNSSSHSCLRTVSWTHQLGFGMASEATAGSFHFQKGSDTNILQPYSNTPLGCSSVPGDGRLNCTLKLDLVDEDGTSQCKKDHPDAVRSDRCGMTLMGLTEAGWQALGSPRYHSVNYRSWTDENGVYRYETTGMFIDIDEANDDTHSNFKLQMQTVGVGTGHRIWENYQFPDFNIQVYSQTGGTTDGGDYFYCFLNSNENDNVRVDFMHGIDSLSLTAEGMYTVFRLSETILEVRLKTGQCGDVICGCGFSVRRNNDVFVCDYCDQHRFCGLVQGDGEYLSSQSGTSSLSVQVGNFWMNAIVYDYNGYPSAHISVNGHLGGVETVEGLCMDPGDGLFSEANEEFAESWRLTDVESLWDPFNDVMYSVPAVTDYYCVCPGVDRDVPDVVEISDHNTYVYTGAVLCSSTDTRTCTSQPTGTVPWPRSLLPDYMLGEVIVTYSPSSVDPFFDLVCSFHTAPSYWYRIHWYLKDQLVLEQGPLTGEEALEQRLESARLRYHMERDEFCIIDAIVCQVFVSSDELDGTAQLTEGRSSDFRLIELSATSIDLLRGSEASIGFTLRAPFLCEAGAACSLDIRLYDPLDSYACTGPSVAMTGTEGCGCRVAGKVPGTSTTTGEVARATVTLINDDRYETESQYIMKAKTVVNGASDSFWGCDIPVDILINVVETFDIRGIRCYAHVDPHMFTFDGRYYEFQFIGQFVLYRHKSKQLQVQIETRRCNAYATCVCAVAIQAGGDVLVIDNCSPDSSYTYYNSKKDGILFAYDLGNMRLKIPLPGSSTLIDLKTIYWGNMYWLNVDIVTSASDFNRVEGLCGNCDGDRTNDLEKRYASAESFKDSWSVENGTQHADESLFSPDFNSDPWEEGKQVCVCPNEVTRHNDWDHICSIKEEDTCTRPKAKKGVLFDPPADRLGASATAAAARRRRDTLQEQVPHSISKRSEGSGITEAEATALVRQEFNTSCSAKNHISSTKTNFNTIENDAILDVMITGTTALTASHCDALRAEVETAADKEANETLTKAVENDLCQNDCGNGTCVEGKCVCGEDLTGLNCEARASVPPDTSSSVISEQCDKSKVDCQCVRFAGKYFISNGTRCKIEKRRADVSASAKFGSEETTETRKTEGTTFTEAYCCYDDQSRKRRSTAGTDFATQYGISFSNDGINYGQVHYVFVLDTTCQEITNDTDGSYTATLMSGFCFISGACVAAEAVNPSESCQKCDPTNDAFAWTSSGCSSSTDPASRLATVYIVVIAVASGTLAVAFIVLLILKFVCKTPRVDPVMFPPVEVNSPRNIRFQSNKVDYLPEWAKSTDHSYSEHKKEFP